MDSLELTGSHLGSAGLTWIHLDSLAFTWDHWACVYVYVYVRVHVTKFALGRTSGKSLTRSVESAFDVLTNKRAPKIGRSSARFNICQNLNEFRRRSV